jgi:hypothetical protein
MAKISAAAKMKEINNQRGYRKWRKALSVVSA